MRGPQKEATMSDKKSFFDWLAEKATADKTSGAPPLTGSGTGGLTQEQVNFYDTTYSES